MSSTISSTLSSPSRHPLVPNNLSGSEFEDVATWPFVNVDAHVYLRPEQHKHPNPACWKNRGKMVSVLYDSDFSEFKQRHSMKLPHHIYRIVVDFEHDEGVPLQEYRASLLPQMLTFFN